MLPHSFTTTDQKYLEINIIEQLIFFTDQRYHSGRSFGGEEYTKHKSFPLVCILPIHCPCRLKTLLYVLGYRMSCPQKCPDEVYKIMQRCWEYKPENRPKFADIQKELASIKKKQPLIKTMGREAKPALHIQVIRNLQRETRQTFRPLNTCYYCTKEYSASHYHCVNCLCTSCFEPLAWREDSDVNIMQHSHDFCLVNSHRATVKLWKNAMVQDGMSGCH